MIELGNLKIESNFFLAPMSGVTDYPYREIVKTFKPGLVFSEMMGVPNPAAYYTLELQPLMLERFHEWHKRMGMEHSPLDHFRCC